MATFRHSSPTRRMMIVACCLAGLICSGCTSGPVGAPSPTATAAGWQMPVDANGGANATHQDWMQFAWQSFLALNWPAQAGGTPGQPDTGQTPAGACPKPGDPVAQCIPTVWTSYLNSEQVFLANGANPGTWAQPTQPLPMAQDPATGQMVPVLGGLSKGTAHGQPNGEFDEAGTNSPLIDQNDQYAVFEVELNQSEFTFIINNGYYDANNQKAAFPPGQPSTFKGFPDGVNNMPADLPMWAQFGATEVKASWRILQTDRNAPNPDIVGRYFTRRAFIETPDGQQLGPYTLGLVGFHILRLTPSTHSTWFWATFEQVDNIQIADQPIPTRPNGQPLTPSFNPGPGTSGPTYPKGFSYQPAKITEGEPLPAPTPVGVSRVTPLPADVVAINSTYRGTLSGTVWQYYQLVNTLNPQAGGPCAVINNSSATVNACEMVNTTMETYTQVQTNCVSCHSFAYPQGAPQPDPNFQIFTFLFGDAQSSASAAQTPAECMGCHGSVAPASKPQ